MISITLPWPPSENHYRRTIPGMRHPILSKEARDYRKAVKDVALGLPVWMRLEGRLAVALCLRAPNRRAYDIDNRAKAALDAMAHAGIYLDDGQIDDLHILRGPVGTGTCEVTIKEIGS